MSLDIIILSTLNTILYASILFMISAGLNLIYGVMRVLNLAHGSFYAFGAYVGAWLSSLFLAAYHPVFLILFPITGAVGAALLALFIEPTLIKPVYERREEYQLLLTFGIMLILEDSIRAIWGSSPLAAREPFRILGSIELAGLSYPAYNLLIIAIGFLAAIFIWLYVNKTRSGVAMRAAATDPMMASALGVDVKRVYTQTFILSSFIAGLAGALIVPTTTAVLGMSIEILILAFVVIVIGGLGSLKGAFIGSLLVGISRIIAINYFPRVELALLYSVAAVILVVKPKGLFGE